MRALRAIRTLHQRWRAQTWFISFPKSGRTWTKTMVESYLQRRLGLPPFALDEPGPLLRLGKQRQVPRLVFRHPECLDVDGGPTEAMLRRLEPKRVVLLVRDPRAVVLTYYFRLKKRLRDPRVLEMSLAEFVRHREYGIARIVDFTNTWFRARDRFQSSLFLRFEDIQSETSGEIARLLRFLEIEVDRGLLDEVIRSTPDLTTRAIEDDTESLSPEDLELIEDALLGLDSAIGYGRPDVDSGHSHRG